MNREEEAKAILNAAAKAILDAAGVLPSERYEEMWDLARRDAAAAFAVFEEACAVGSFVPAVSDAQETAHAPSTDEREALQREFGYRIRTGWALAHAYEKGTITAQRKKELIRDEIDGAMASLAVAGFFRRTVQGEPTDERAIAAIRRRTDEEDFPLHLAADIEQIIVEVGQIGESAAPQREPSGVLHAPMPIDRIVIGDNLLIIDSDGTVRGRIDQTGCAAREFVTALESEIRALRAPQREPSDAAVLAALNAAGHAESNLYESAPDLGYFVKHSIDAMRAALRAAAEAKGGNRG